MNPPEKPGHSRTLAGEPLEKVAREGVSVPGQPKFLLAALLVFLVAVALRGFNLWYSTPIVLGGDEPEYVGLAENLIREGRFVSSKKIQVIFQGGRPGEPTAYRSPVLPFFLAIHYKLFGSSHTWPRLSLILLSSAVCLFLAFMGKLIGNPSAGLLASTLWAINPPSVFGDYSSDRLYSEALSTFLLTGAFMFLALFYARPVQRHVVMSALFLGLAILSRGYLLFALPLCMCWLFFFPAGRRWRTLLLFTVITSTVVGLWVYRNWAVMGKPLLSTQTEAFYLGNNLWARGSFNGDIFTQGYGAPQFRIIKERYPHVMEMSEIERSEMWTREAIRSIRDYPKHFLWLLMRKTLIFWGPFQHWSFGWYRWHYLFSLLLPFAIYASVRKQSGDSIRFTLLLLIPIVAVFFAALITYGFDRYRFMIEPFVFLLGAIGIVRVAGLLLTRRSKAAVGQI
ncbi:MAG: glycosyltransferase family 39 protein [Blastocatellales bacterium]